MKQIQENFERQLIFGKPVVAGSGGVEPPLLVTLDSIPRSMQELVLDPEDEGTTDEILGEMKKHGHEVAVAFDRKKNFNDVVMASLMNSMIHRDPNKIYTNSPNNNWAAGCIVPNQSNNFTLDVD